MNTHQPHNLLMMMAIPPRRTQWQEYKLLVEKGEKKHTTTKQTDKKMLPFLFPFFVEKEANWSKSLCDASKMIGESEYTTYQQKVIHSG